MRCVAKPKPGDVFVVSAAGGAVGSIAGQIAKRDGAYVIGIAGGPAKVAYLTGDLGFDAAIDYKNDDVNARLRELAPQGVNVFFDNVGGPILDAVLDNLALRAKVVICGAISQYDDMDHVTGPSMYLRLAERQSSMEGFAFFHFPDSIVPATAELASWLADGSIQVALSGSCEPAAPRSGGPRLRYVSLHAADHGVCDVVGCVDRDRGGHSIRYLTCGSDVRRAHGVAEQLEAVVEVARLLDQSIGVRDES